MIASQISVDGRGMKRFEVKSPDNRLFDGSSNQTLEPGCMVSPDRIGSGEVDIAAAFDMSNRRIKCLNSNRCSATRIIANDYFS